MSRNVETRAREAIVFALKERSSDLPKVPRAREQQTLEPRPEHRKDFDLEKAVDEVMTRFADTLDYLAR